MIADENKGYSHLIVVSGDLGQFVFVFAYCYACRWHFPDNGHTNYYGSCGNDYPVCLPKKASGLQTVLETICHPWYTESSFTFYIGYLCCRQSQRLVGSDPECHYPLFTMVVSAVWLKEKLTPKKLTGLVIGLAGLTVLVGWIPLALTQKVVISIVFSLLAALSYGIGAVYTRRSLRHAEPLKTATGQITAAAILAVPLIGYSSTSGAIGLDLSIAITVLAIVCTALGYTLYFKLITSVGSTNASLVTLLVPVFSLLWSILFLNEPLTPALLIGLAMILGSLKLVLAPSK